MTKREFVKVAGMLGLSLPFQGLFTACANAHDDPQPIFEGSVLIIGAGAAGMASGYLLAQNNIDFQILEASNTYGGRMKTNKTFADFPIPLGAEWLHVQESALAAIINDPSVPVTTQTQAYSSQDLVGYYDNTNYTEFAIGNGIRNFIDQKFINTTWLVFFEEFILPSVNANIQFDTQILSIDYVGDKVILTDANQQTYEADKVIVTVPLKILQSNIIQFNPPLPNRKQRLIDEALVWDGFKAFIAFKEKFYPSFIEFPDSDTPQGQRTYYDAAYGQNTQSHILGLFAVGEQARPYQNLSGDAQRDYMLQELDQIFGGVASQHYIKHLVQNWNEEPFIQAAYLADEAPSRISRVLAEPLDQKVYFAGDAYTQEDDWSAVHNAARSARDAVQEIMRKNIIRR